MLYVSASTCMFKRSIPQAATWGRQITLGGGLDYSLPYFHRHLSLRLFQADYVLEHVDFGPGGLADFDSGRFSTAPVAFACTATPQVVFRGDPLSVIGVATNLDRHRTVTFCWSGRGVTVNASQPVVELSSQRRTQLPGIKAKEAVPANLPIAQRSSL
jgi:hypothetical protein